jgi:hypothetical protein
MGGIAGRDLDEIFRALASDLQRRDAPIAEICVIGGSALNMLGLIDRPTRDVDVLGLAESDPCLGLRIRTSKPLPESLREAAASVAEQLLLEGDWLNCGPTDLLDAGLPAGFEGRLVPRRYGDRLVVHLASGPDLICFKTYASADIGGRHLADLIALVPTEAEMERAFRWTIDQDPSEGFRTQLRGLADYLGVRHVLDRLDG